MNYEPGTPQTPTPRSSPLDSDESFSWPAPYYDAANTNRPPTTGPSSAPEVQWEIWLEDVSRSTYALIDGHSLYVLGDRRLAVVDRRTGELDRSESLPINPRTAPTLTEDGLVLSVRNDDGSNALALVGTDGELHWKRDGGNAVLPPAVADGRIFAPSGEELVAREVADGSVAWRHTADEGERLTTYPAVGDGIVAVLGSAGNAYAVDTTSGERRWRSGANTDGSPAIAASIGDGRVYGGFEGDAGYVAFDGDSGEVRWQSGGPPPVGIHAVADRAIVSSSREGQVTAHRGQTGDEQWTAAGGAKPPVVAGETAYVRGSNPEVDGERLVALSLADGTRRWQRQVSGGGWLLVADGYCYVNFGSGVVQCLG